jgi:Zn-dependent protease
MRWAWKIAKVGGIELRVHVTFLLLIGWVGFEGYLKDRTLGLAFGSVLFVLAVFAAIVLHELGHALAAKRFGIKTRQITLYPIGGAAELERIPKEPLQELLVALAGPAVSFVLAAILFAFGPGFWAELATVNLTIGLFNLLPAFPMDGGRILRATLASRISYARATLLAARFGQAAALLFALLGVLFNPMLLFIALLVWMGAAAEASAAQLGGKGASTA